MVAMIFVILFGFVGGLKSTLLSAGDNHNWIVLERGALSEWYWLQHRKCNY